MLLNFISNQGNINKSTIRYHDILPKRKKKKKRDAKTKKTDSNKRWRILEAAGNFIYYW